MWLVADLPCAGAGRWILCFSPPLAPHFVQAGAESRKPSAELKNKRRIKKRFTALDLTMTGEKWVQENTEYAFYVDLLALLKSFVKYSH